MLQTYNIHRACEYDAIYSKVFHDKKEEEGEVCFILLHKAPIT